MIFHSKSRILRKISKDLSVNVFNKTFSVYDPYPARGTLHRLAFLPVFVFGASLLVEVVALKTFGTGVFTSVAVFLLSLSPMMIVEAYETYTSANLFLNAVKNEADLGKGDLQVLSLVKAVTPRLSVYYVLLAGVFLTLSLILPLIGSPVLMAFSMLFSLPLGSASEIGIAAPYLTLFLFTVLFMTAYFAGGKLKNRIFGFPSAVPLTSLEEQFETVKIMAHWAETPPYEWSHRTIEEEPVILKRKMKELRGEKEKE
jgi:hypothetical protein